MQRSSSVVVSASSTNWLRARHAATNCCLRADPDRSHDRSLPVQQISRSPRSDQDLTTSRDHQMLTVISSPRFADHLTPPGHPERPERAEAMAAVVERFRLGGGRVVAPRPATDDDCCACTRRPSGGDRRHARARGDGGPRHLHVARFRARGAAGGRRRADRRRCRARRTAGFAGAGGRPSSRASRRAGQGDGLLPLQQHRRGRSVRAVARTVARGDRGLSTCTTATAPSGPSTRTRRCSSSPRTSSRPTRYRRGERDGPWRGLGFTLNLPLEPGAGDRDVLPRDTSARRCRRWRGSSRS